MSSQPFAYLDLKISILDSSEEELDMYARLLFSELHELNVESVELALGCTAADGTKTAASFNSGALAVAILPVFLPRLLEFLQAWSRRGHGRTVKLKGKVSGTDIEYECAAEDF